MSIAEDEALHFAATTSLLYSKHMDVALADAYKHQSNRADILRTLKLKTEVNQ